MKYIVSIIIPSYRRLSRLNKLLKYLSNEINQNLEIIVVVQAGRKRKVKKAESITHLYLAEPSMTHARNVGAGRAKGEFLLFLDDDVTVRKGLIENHLINFKDKKVAAVCGRVITDGQRVENDNTNVGRVGLLGGVGGGFSSTVKQEIDTVIGCNMCWRRDVYLRLGGVDEQFTGNALREETDLSLRAKKAGYKIIFEPKAVVVHHRAETGGARKSEGRLQWYFDFFSNETYFYLKHFNKLLLPIFLLTKTEWALRCMFGFGREVSVRSMLTPLAGIIDGIKKYYDYRR